ncbi:MAG: hypothetical protein EHJ94_09940 [Deltaproteobacteria bacterium]|nr:MAG: hypothetical protein EHJ94_09940 [Deltaproteobacteria bacterium]
MNFRHPLLIFILLLHTISCATTTRIEPLPQQVEQHFKVGDTLIVHTFDGKITSLELLKMTPDVLIGPQHTIPFSHISKIEKQSLTLGKISIPIDEEVAPSIYISLGIAGLILLSFIL